MLEFIYRFLSREEHNNIQMLEKQIRLSLCLHDTNLLLIELIPKLCAVIPQVSMLTNGFQGTHSLLQVTELSSLD